MKNLLLAISSIFLLSQIAILISINFFENEFLKYSLLAANKKVEIELDNRYEQLNSDSKFSWGKKIAGLLVKNVDDKILKAKDFITDETENILKDFNAGHLIFDVEKNVEFDIFKIISNRDYASKYFRSQLLKSIDTLRNDLNILFGSNILMLFFIIILTLKSQKSKAALRLAWLALIAVVVSTILFVISKDWLYSILLNSSLGYVYIAILLLIFIILIELVVNRGRILGSISV